VIAGLALLAVIGVTLPHALRLDSARPATAAILWTAALTLRALTAVLAALYLVLVLPETSVFKFLTHWCVHSALAAIGVHADFHGHAIGGAAVLTPPALIALSVLAALVGTMRAARAVAATLCRASLGAGPQNSVIVGGPEVLVAAAGLIHPKVVVSAGALTVLDDEELAAGLAHENGHIARRHHLALAYAELCRAIARMLPGTRRAVQELRFHLERDADDWAVRRHHDPVALASAICKAATTGASHDPRMVTLGGGAIERRVDGLLGTNLATIGRLRRRMVDSAAALMVCVTLASLVAIPAEALAGDRSHVGDHSEHRCVVTSA
jgi:bla regulator protein blaR1